MIEHLYVKVKGQEREDRGEQERANYEIGSLNARNWEEMVFIERFWLILFHVFVWECSFQILLKLHWDLLRKKQANIQKA